MRYLIHYNVRTLVGSTAMQNLRRYMSNAPRIDVLFFGTDKFSLPSLKKIHQNSQNGGRVQNLNVVTSFKAAKNPVKNYCRVEDIPIHDWTSFKQNVNKTYDLGVVVSFGHLISESIIDSFQRGMLNVHASLLPKLRGAAPIVHAIANGETRTGISIMRIKPKQFDVGEIVMQSSVDIGRDTLMPQLHDELAQIGAGCIIDCIENIETYYDNLVEQDDSQATYAPKIDPKFAEIRWTNMTAIRVYDLYRSLYGFRPLCTCFGGEIVKIFKMSIDRVLLKTTHHDTARRAGHIDYNKRTKQLLVYCCDGATVEISQLSIRGKKTISGQEFYNGFLSKVEPSERFFT